MSFKIMFLDIFAIVCDSPNTTDITGRSVMVAPKHFAKQNDGVNVFAWG